MTQTIRPLPQTAVPVPVPGISAEAGAEHLLAGDEADQLRAAADALSVLAIEQGLAGQMARRAEALAWRATTLRVRSEITGTASAWRQAHSAARIALVAAWDAETLPAPAQPQAGPAAPADLPRAALARATLELGLGALALGSAERSAWGGDLLREALRLLGEAEPLLTARGQRAEARKAELAAIEARARLSLRGS